MLRTVLFATKPEYYWVSLLLFLGAILVAILWFRQENQPEGFHQDGPYLFLAGPSVYSDPVYISYHDKLMLPSDVLDNLTTEIVEMTQPHKTKSSFLDLGFGTGLFAATLAKKGYIVYGVDKSQEMLDKAHSQYDQVPHFYLKRGDFLEPMLWESGSFSHITCTGFTLYTVQDKRRLLENCFHWLRPGGFLIVHLVDTQKFQAIIPGGRPPLPVTSTERVTNTMIDFVDFQYKASFLFPNDTTMELHESFVDSQHVRQLNQTFYTMPVRDILTMAVHAGFSGQGYATLKHDAHQYLYIFVKPT